MQKKRVKWIVGSLALAAALTGCAKKPTANDDPFQSYNRVMFAFNMGVDRLTLRPIAIVYSKITPPPLRHGVTNVFANIDEISTFPNDFLQGNFKYMAVDFWRLVINTTFGVGGLFDVATRFGIQPHSETFGLTIAKWRGGKQAPYFVLPFFGPSSIQNGIGTLADYYMNFWPYLKDQNITYYAHAVKYINVRAELLPADKMVETAFDPYIFVRDAYMQRQAQKIAENEALGKHTQHNETLGEMTPRPSQNLLD